ncbi:MAG: LPS export ABC transporter permease LptG [Gammaproteobacteria bacterium]|nr:MAG: LPS export ABC transporter permease LptG [Gammaproteobacteria bacterium]
MIRLLDRQVGRAVLAGVAGALAVLLALDAVFALVDALEDVGRGAFTATDAVLVVLLHLPARARELLPAAVLVGALLGLGRMAAQGELVAWRAAGASPARIARAALQAGVLWALFAVWLGEAVVLPAETAARRVEAKTLGVAAQPGAADLWLRDGARVLHVGRVLPGPRLVDVEWFTVTEDGVLNAAAAAEALLPAGGGWRARGWRETVFTEEQTRAAQGAQRPLALQLPPATVAALSVAAEHLPFLELRRQTAHLERNGLDAGPYRLALWSKAVAPAACLVLLLLALPRVFAPPRALGAGQLLLAGILWGLGFYLLLQLALRLTVVFDWPPALTSALPLAIFAALGVAGLRRVR